MSIGKRPLMSPLKGMRLQCCVHTQKSQKLERAFKKTGMIELKSQDGVEPDLKHKKKVIFCSVLQIPQKNYMECSLTFSESWIEPYN